MFAVVFTVIALNIFPDMHDIITEQAILDQGNQTRHNNILTVTNEVHDVTTTTMQVKMTMKI